MPIMAMTRGGIRRLHRDNRGVADPLMQHNVTTSRRAFKVP
jgi:hypothetical protein